MRFWDTSAVVGLLVDESHSREVTKELDDDPEMIVWWATPIECVSAIARREREGSLDSSGVSDALSLLDDIQQSWSEVEPGERLRAQAIRLLRVHPLRASDSLQLAAAIVAAEMTPRTLPIVTLDERLRAAASREGFPVRPTT